jgi:hypothetical protein
MVVFWCPRVFVTISNPDSPSRSETGVNPGIRSLKTIIGQQDVILSGIPIIALHIDEQWQGDNVRNPLVVFISKRSEELTL